uniref:Uncharacterized protein n=1 Tax=Daphnia galeata TaxID=27404 RepID=A0A8J2S8M6_9CRUS|nr:unnamed protein product [Daphnia galeata]
METNNSPLKRIPHTTVTNESEFTVKSNLIESSMPEVSESPWESVIIAATRQTMVMPVISHDSFISDYFTRPREPVVFNDELFGHDLTQETVTYWHRPLQPVTTDTDLYPIVL